MTAISSITMFRFLLLGLWLLLVCAPISWAQGGRSIAVPVFEFAPAQGSWDKLTNAVSSGRIYDFAVAMDTYEMDSFVKQSRVVFANPGSFDALECWVSVAQQPHTGQTRFLIMGDGVLLYRSQWMTWRDRAEKVRVSIRGYKGISLIAEGNGMNKFDMAIWGEPVLIESNPPELGETSNPLPETQGNPPQLSEASRSFPDTITVRQFDNGSIGVSVGGANVEFGKAKLLNEGGRLLVPIRPIFEALGARVSYNPLSHQIVATRGTQVISMITGTQSATIDGRQIELDVPSRIVAGETMVPLRFVAESLGASVEYKR